MAEINSTTITNMLEERAKSNRHVFFSEVTDYGRSVDGRQSRIDAIAMKMSYSKIQLWGYEIKVSRRDFIQDEKWHQYLKMCNSLYFVCPHGLISKAEVPEEAGLMYVSKTGSVLRTVKKAPYRPVEYRPTYFMGMIFNKCNLGTDEEDTRASRMRQALKHASLKEDCVELGRMLGSGLAIELEELRRVQEQQASKIKQLQEVEEYLRAEGIEVPGSEFFRINRYQRSLKEQLERRREQLLRSTGIEEIQREVHQTVKRLQRFQTKLTNAAEEASC